MSLSSLINKFLVCRIPAAKQERLREETEALGESMRENRRGGARVIRSAIDNIQTSERVYLASQEAIELLHKHKGQTRYERDRST